jgi:hypothetical protein
MQSVRDFDVVACSSMRMVRACDVAARSRIFPPMFLRDVHMDVLMVVIDASTATRLARVSKRIWGLQASTALA